MEIKLEIDIEAQPDDTTCGPTALHAVYKYYGIDLTLSETIREVTKLDTGGTLAVLLGVHALRQGLTANIYTYNLQVFDPTWFNDKNIDIADKLTRQLEFKPNNERLRKATEGYLEYIKLGGKISQQPLSSSLIRNYLNKNVPVLAGLSATYLYNESREYGYHGVYDDVRGEPSGHFVILSGYNKTEKRVQIADPYEKNPFGGSKYYSVEFKRLITSILLGIWTYDANLLILQPKKG
ncbi:C39 family peptidase [Leptospira sp. GIMC2001]|uniref:C39 family peptidase n=1 Tax=Leptospira sp. GIMC2001 TaxID=1513297 RepID=UPI0023491D00|nr:C39 family peptidase [Leptospira sp. GIMC2001]WCL49975.1 C39 family peptidase [Leptospira sp. GIMC2001]